jgi:hypothetical protein
MNCPHWKTRADAGPMVPVRKEHLNRCLAIICFAVARFNGIIFNETLRPG